MIYSGEYFLKKTIDKGRIWNPVLKDDVYFYKTILAFLLLKIKNLCGAQGRSQWFATPFGDMRY